MATTRVAGVVTISADPALGDEARSFAMAKSEYEDIVRTGLSTIFEAAAFAAQVLLSERIQLAEDPYDIDLSEEFELSEGPGEELPEHWTIEFQPRSSRYVVQSEEI